MVYADRRDTLLRRLTFPALQIGPGSALKTRWRMGPRGTRRVPLVAPHRRQSPRGPLVVDLPNAVEQVRRSEIHSKNYPRFHALRLSTSLVTPAARRTSRTDALQPRTGNACALTPARFGIVFAYVTITLYGSPFQGTSTNDWIGNSTVTDPTTPVQPEGKPAVIAPQVMRPRICQRPPLHA
jgi:hypothetical protein